jgi:hypothetical protein
MLILPRSRAAIEISCGFRNGSAIRPSMKSIMGSGARGDWSVATASGSVRTSITSKRTHMNHGNPDLYGAPAPTVAGPRRAMPIGFEATRHTGNILRLLEASHGSYSFNTVDTLSTVWHPKAVCWMFEVDEEKWTPLSPMEALTAQEDERMRRHTAAPLTTASMMMPQQATLIPRLQSLTFSDDRTALVKLLMGHGSVRYLSILRLDENTQKNDGWIILRELQVPPSSSSSSSSASAESNFEVYTSLQLTLRQYLNIEHGGGTADASQARALFAPQASLVTVGMDDPSQPVSDWSAPVGSVLEIPLETYLAGVQSQTSHSGMSRTNDEIVR